MSRSVQFLLDAGFVETARFARESGRARLKGRAPEEAGVYAFVRDDEVVFAGAAERGLERRLRGFIRKQDSGDLDRRVHAELGYALARGETVRVFVVTPEPLDWHGFEVCPVEGIAAGLVAKLAPDWNRRRLTRLRSPWLRAARESSVRAA